MTEINQQAQNSNIKNMVAGDQHIHFHLDSQHKINRSTLLTALLDYRKQEFFDFHNLLCDYAQTNFGTGKFADLKDNELQKLYYYSKRIHSVSDQLQQRKPLPQQGFRFLMSRWVKKWIKNN